MTVTAYFAVAAITAAYFFASDGIESGEYEKALAAIVIAALWPVSVGAGFGLMLRDACRWLKRFAPKGTPHDPR